VVILVSVGVESCSSKLNATIDCVYTTTCHDDITRQGIQTFVPPCVCSELSAALPKMQSALLESLTKGLEKLVSPGYGATERSPHSLSELEPELIKVELKPGKE
jgi:hypothetical protein